MFKRDLGIIFTLLFLSTILGGVSQSAAQTVSILIKSTGPISGARLLKTAHPTNASWYELEIPAAGAAATIQKFKANPQVEKVEENFRVRIEPEQVVESKVSKGPTPIYTNDPFLGNQWSLQTMQVFDAWGLVPVTAQDVLVAITDTGIDFSDDELAARIYTNPNEIPNNGIDDDQNGYIDDIHGWDFQAHNNNPSDDINHGTHVAGIIGAIQNNNFGIAGIAPRVQLMPLRWLGQVDGQSADAVEAIHYAVKMGARVINASWGGEKYSQALDEAVQDAQAHGVLFVVAAGNANNDLDAHPDYPAAFRYDNVITVANTDENDGLNSDSNYGLKNVDLGAPGTAILSTFMGNQFQLMSGTSMSAAEVSGVAALLLAINPNLAARDLKRILTETVDKIPSLAGKTVSGGRINAYRAAKKVVAEMHGVREAVFVLPSLDSDFFIEGLRHLFTLP